MVCDKFAVLVILMLLLPASQSLNILGLFPHPGGSHFWGFEPLLRALAEKGHNVTVISAFPQNEPLPRYRDISIRKETKIAMNFFDMDTFEQSVLNPIMSSFMIAGLAKEMCAKLRSKPIQDFLKSDEKFDLILMEMFNSDCYLGFVHKYKVPFIGLCPNTVMPWSNEMFGNSANPSFVPMLMIQYSDRMSFLERVHNTIGYVGSLIVYKMFVQAPSYAEAKLHFGDDLPPLDEISRNISLMLTNSHFSLNLPRPFVPNIIEVGGMFVGKPKKLPQNIEKFINESQHGVIYFSLGSMLKGHTLPENKRKAFINVFSKLKQRVLWKWENDSMLDQPPNVMIQKWMPQLDILCHPNVVAFISHGGLLSTTETVYCGVPAVVMPQYGDQFSNAKAMEVRGAGVILNLEDATENMIADALNQILQPSFKKRTEMFSNVYKDRPLPPLETAIYWVEYVARHNGAFHLHSAATELNLYQYLLLDVILFIVGILVAMILFLYYVVKFIFKMLSKIFVKTNIKRTKIKKN